MTAYASHHNSAELPEPKRIIRMREVTRITGISRSTIYRMLAATPQLFPPPLRISKCAIGWTTESINAWFASREVAFVGQGG